MNNSIVAGLLLVVFCAVSYFLFFQQDVFLQTSIGQFIQDPRFNITLIAPEIIVTITLLFLVVFVAFSKTDEERQETWYLTVLVFRWPFFL